MQHNLYALLWLFGCWFQELLVKMWNQISIYRKWFKFVRKNIRNGINISTKTPEPQRIQWHNQKPKSLRISSQQNRNHDKIKRKRHESFTNHHEIQMKKLQRRNKRDDLFYFHIISWFRFSIKLRMNSWIFCGGMENA